MSGSRFKRFLPGNPWQLVNKKTGDDRDQKMLDIKALSQAAMAEVLRFVESVGLRSAELLGAKLQDLQLEPEG